MLGLSTALWTNGLAALGLGDIDLKSALDQKLDAEIQLLEVRDLTKDEILIGLAEQAAFDRQGVERSYFLTNIKFDVDLNASGGPVVRLSSDQPVREPFIDFILEARWPSGKLLREYTVLLDLPVYAEDTPAPASPVQTETVVERQQSNQSTRSASSSSTSTSYNNPRSSFDEGRSASQSSASRTSYTPSYTGDDYRVQSNDTLWEIALDVRPDSSVSVHQTMIALHRANPEAFINGNINLLKAGKVLRIPEQDEIRSLNARDAVRQVAQHNRDWNTGETAAPLEASDSRIGTQVEQTRGEGRLSLVSPEESYGAQSGRASGSDSESSSESEALKQELAATQETLDKTRGENQDLQTKIGSLEEQIRTLESMIEVSNESLRAMELAAAQGKQSELPLTEEGSDVLADSPAMDDESLVGADEAEASIDEGLAETEGGEGIASEEGQTAEASQSEESDSTVESPADVAAESAEAKKAAPDPSKVVYSAPKKESSILDILKEYFLFIGLGVLAIGAGIFFFLKKRKEDEEFDDFLDQDYDYESSDQAEAAEESVDEAVMASDALDDLADEDTSEEGLADETSPEAEEAAEPETEDVVAESDIYIAYGKYDQAEEMLLKALKSRPDHHEARLKLLEIYATQGNVEGFDPNYAALISGGAAASLVSRAELLRENIADAPEFDASMYGAEDSDTGLAEDEDVFEEELSEELDLDLGDDDAHETELNLDAITFDSDTKTDLAESDELESAESEDLGAELESEADKIADFSDESSTQSTTLELAGDSEDASSDEGIEFDLDGLEFESSPDLADDPLDEIEGVQAAEGIEIADDFELGEGVSASLDIETEDTPEFDLSDLETADLVAPADDLDISESELGAPSLQDELETDLGAIDFDLDGLEDVSEEIESDKPAEVELPSTDEVTDEIEELDIDLSSDEPESEKGIDSDEAAELEDEITDLPAPEVQDELEEVSLESVALDLDDTLVRGGIEEQSDELPEIESDLDLESLDAELDELSADLDETDLDKGVDELASLDAELDAELESDISEPVVETEPEAEFETAEKDLEFELDSGEKPDELDNALVEDDDLDATLAEGEQMLAELEDEQANVESEETEDAATEPDAFEAFDTKLEDLPSDTELTDAAEEFDTEFTEEGDDPAESSEAVTEFEEFDLGDLDQPETSESASDAVEAFEQFDSFDEGGEPQVKEVSDDTGAESPASDDDADNTETNEAGEDEAASEQAPEVASGSDLDSLGFELPDIDPEATDDSDLDFLSSSDEISTKLDLAAAYVDMGDASGAREILEEVIAEGSDEQKMQANSLLDRLKD